MEEFEPPTGTAQVEREVGGVGIWDVGAQDMVVGVVEVYCVEKLLWKDVDGVAVWR